jgi:hypothetical protein
MEITNEDLGQVFLFDPTYRTETFTFSGAGTLAAGTILGRVTASGKLVACDLAAVNGSQVPVAIVDYDVVATGAGDKTIRAGIAGKFRAEKGLFANADPVTAAVLDQLRSMSLIPVLVTDISLEDNQ